MAGRMAARDTRPGSNDISDRHSLTGSQNFEQTGIRSTRSDDEHRFPNRRRMARLSQWTQADGVAVAPSWMHGPGAATCRLDSGGSDSGEKGPC
jgi:hypothetical protein